MTLTIVDVVSLIASITSLILGVLAIWLSITFYKMSAKESKNAENASAQMKSSVDRLEKLFDKLYSDTFSMMKDTVSDMRKHIWNNDSNPKTNQKEIRDLIEQEISKLKLFDGQDNGNKDEVVSELTDLVGSLSRTEVGFVDEELILRYMYENGASLVPDIADFLEYEEDDVAFKMFDIRREGFVTWKGDKNKLDRDKLILPRRERIKEYLGDCQ